MTISSSRRVRESDAFIYRATLLRKLIAYAESHRQGIHKKHLGIPAARVLTLTTTAARAEAIRAVAHELVVKPMNLPPGLFLFGAQAGECDPLAQGFLNAEATLTPLVRPAFVPSA